MPSLLHDLWNQGRQAALSLVFPDSCALCQGNTTGSPVPAVCGACLPSLPRVGETRCLVCGEWFVGAVPGPFRCTNCADRRFAFEFATAPFQARAGVRDLIHQFKYDRQLWLAPSLGRLLADALRGPHADPRIANGSWILVPVPLHPRRLREREFNQAAELAASLSRLTGHPLADVMERVRYTTGQASLDRHDRLANLQGAFRLRRRWLPRRPNAPPLAGRDVLLIDDVFTTGATMHECARVLNTETAARRVAALTFARG
ncbi:MAG: ComF family protein [Verrucomicrobiales bacterium]